MAVEGYLELRQGALPRVSWGQPSQRRPAVSTSPQDLPRWDFRPGRPDAASFPRAAWTRAQRKVLARAPDAYFGYGDPCGSIDLRRALAGYLGRARGVDTDPARLLTCGGFTQALALLCLVLRRDGVSALAVEDPCAPRYRELLRTMGLDVVPVACDADGLRVDLLAESGVR